MTEHSRWGKARIEGREPKRAREELRADWGVSAKERLVLALPPVTRAAGTMVAAWGLLLAQKAMAELRLVLPPGDAEFDRVRRLFQDVRAIETLLAPSAEVGLAELLAASDAAIFVPAEPVDVAAVRIAAEAGIPLILNGRGRAHTADGAPVVECREDEPKGVARAILQAMGRL